MPLVLNLWLGDTKRKLMFGGTNYGHAAMWLPGAGDHMKSAYISWWPGSGTREEGKKGKTYSVKHSKSRTVKDDMWSEYSNRYRSKLLFSMPLSDLDFFTEATKDEMGRKMLATKLLSAFNQNGGGFTTQESQVLVGVKTEHKQWVIEDLAKGKCYIAHRGSNDIKIMQLTGHRFFGSFEVEKKHTGDRGEAVTFYKCGSYRNWLSDALDKCKLPNDEERWYASVLSDNQKLVYMDHKGFHTYYLSIVPSATSDSHCTVRVYRWTAAMKAPDVVFRLPTVSHEGYGLDDEAIRRWWFAVDQSEAKWSTLDSNCSTVAATALFVGGARSYCKPATTSSWLCWTPSSVLEYAKKLKDAMEANKDRPQQLPDGLEDFNLNDILPETGYDPERESTSIVWTRSKFRKETSLDWHTRPKKFKQLDQLLREYNGQTWGTISRMCKLDDILNKVAEIFMANPETKRKAGLLQLAERCITERAALKLNWQVFDDDKKKRGWKLYRPSMLALLSPYIREIAANQNNEDKTEEEEPVVDTTHSPDVIARSDAFGVAQTTGTRERSGSCFF